MTTEPDRAKDPFAAFVVETRVKPDGRRIHYYEWPEPEPDQPAREPADPRHAPTEARRV